MSEPSSTREGRGFAIETLASATRPIRRAGRRILHRVERLLHPQRHRRACTRIRSLGEVDSILFVCLGNICRSPYAEHRFRLIAQGGQPNQPGTIDSAGFILPGRPSPHIAQGVAERRGLDLSVHRSRTMTKELLQRFDLVLVMTEAQRIDLHRRFDYDRALHLGDLDPGPISSRDIPDPYGKEEHAFDHVFTRIDRATAQLQELITSFART